MKMSKKNPRKQLEKFSTIFTQLGLVLALFIVFISLEYESVKETSFNPPSEGYTLEIPYELDRGVIIVKKVKEVKKTQPKKKKPVQYLTKFTKTDNDDTIATVIDAPTDDDIPIIDVDSFDEKYEDDIDKNDDPKPISINNVQNAPVFKGCEDLSETENRKCFERKIQRHVQRYFNADLAQDVGLNSGKYRISTQFIIDKDGEIIDIQIRAPHIRLKKEANKVVSKIPLFTPGKQNNKPVKVKYTLPITFKVE